jgi:hypothetical protein
MSESKTLIKITAAKIKANTATLRTLAFEGRSSPNTREKKDVF